MSYVRIGPMMAAVGPVYTISPGAFVNLAQTVIQRGDVVVGAVTVHPHIVRVVAGVQTQS